MGIAGSRIDFEGVSCEIGEEQDAERTVQFAEQSGDVSRRSAFWNDLFGEGWRIDVKLVCFGYTAGKSQSVHALFASWDGLGEDENGKGERKVH